MIAIDYLDGELIERRVTKCTEYKHGHAEFEFWHWYIFDNNFVYAPLLFVLCMMRACVRNRDVVRIRTRKVRYPPHAGPLYVRQD